MDLQGRFNKHPEPSYALCKLPARVHYKKQKYNIKTCYGGDNFIYRFAFSARAVLRALRVETLTSASSDRAALWNNCRPTVSVIDSTREETVAPSRRFFLFVIVSWFP